MSDGRVIVLGGTGFLGRQVCMDLAASGDDVLAVARTAPRPAPAYRFRSLDVSRLPTGDLVSVLAAERPDAVVNATGGKWGLSDRELEASCVVPTRRLLAALERLRYRPRLVHLGSVLEYGPIAPGGRTSAAQPLRPTTTYGKTKLAATQAVLTAAAAGTVDAIVLRIANVAGPGTPAVSLLGRVAGQLAEAAAGGEPAKVELTSLRAHRDYVDVRDVSDAVLAATRAPVTGTAIGIGRGEAVPVRSLVELLIEVSGVAAHVVELPTPAGSPDLGDWTRVDPRPARELLGWSPRRTLRDSVRGLWDEVRARTGVPERSSAVPGQ
ncbi:NAD-dependent epimerase/dehydratase family protein [Streptosporangium sp. NPDC003464]